MLSIDDNIYMTQVDRGSAMGDFLRLFWVPALLSSELPGPDCAPIRVTLLGEKLIAFRDSSGKVGLLFEKCPHRRASLFFGRNEEMGIKVVGTDACSIDALVGHQGDGLPPAHLTLLGAGIPQIEDLKSLGDLPKHFYVVIAPMKLARSSGAPVRVLAFV